MRFFTFRLNIVLCTLFFMLILSFLAPFCAIFSLPSKISIAKNQLNGYLNTQNNSLITSKFNTQNSTLDYYLLNTIKLKSVSANILPTKKVFLGGQTVGFEYNTKGVLVIGKNKVYSNNQFIDNLQNNELMQGDIIISVNGTEVNSAKEISGLINQEQTDAKYVTIKAMRKGKEYQTKIKPAYDLLTKKYKLGLWVKNDVSGLGTLTYIDPTNNTYGALGHSIIEPNTNSLIPVLNGKLYDCAVLGIKRAVRGSAGEIRGILKTNVILGDVQKNASTGVFGQINIDNKLLKDNYTEIEVGGKYTIIPGKALMYCCIDGKNVRAYDIEIVKLNNKNETYKDMVIKVTDPRLIKATGGIVQGMSGSPIVQNGKLVGAVTHVFVNDATKGFGVFIDNMLKN